MSEREEQFFSRAETALKTLEKTKAWYKSAAMAFAVSFIVCVFGAGAIGYKIGLMQVSLNGKASIDSVRMLKDSTNDLANVLTLLIEDEDHKKVAETLTEKYRIMSENIFFYTATRGAETYKDEKK